MTAHCWHCGMELPPSRGGRPRKWCSERCRKRQYDGVCTECGGRTSGTSPGRKATTLCEGCANTPERLSARARAGHEYHAAPRRAHIIRRWAEGASIRTIADELGTSVAALSVDLDRLRKAGLIAYRYKMRGGKRVAA